MSETIYDTAKLKDPSHKRNFSTAPKNVTVDVPDEGQGSKKEGKSR